MTVGARLLKETVSVPADVSVQVTGTAARRLHRPAAPNVTGPGTLTLSCLATAADSIAIGQNRIFSVTLRLINSVALSRTVTDSAIVDPDAAIAETSDANNASAPVSIAVTPPAPPPGPTLVDLALTKTAVVDPVILAWATPSSP
ncbi:MAG: hypothetical protein U0531_19385 [Dehalococcoidia bacterium]